jgi:hypothetical protein
MSCPRRPEPGFPGLDARPGGHDVLDLTALRMGGVHIYTSAIRAFVDRPSVGDPLARWA